MIPKPNLETVCRIDMSEYSSVSLENLLIKLCAWVLHSSHVWHTLKKTAITSEDYASVFSW